MSNMKTGTLGNLPGHYTRIALINGFVIYQFEFDSDKRRRFIITTEANDNIHINSTLCLNLNEAIDWCKHHKVVYFIHDLNSNTYLSKCSDLESKTLIFIDERIPDKILQFSNINSANQFLHKNFKFRNFLEIDYIVLPIDKEKEE